ncbi:MAG: DUF3592 domain-containing protein [Protaetiibacter sp.]
MSESTTPPPRRRRMFVLFLVVAGVIAVFVAGTFVVTSIQRDDLIRTGEQVQASPTGQFVSRTRNDNQTYYVVWGYTVEGREYTITGTERHLSRTSARRYIAQLDGATATVYYDPADPGRAFLGEEP